MKKTILNAFKILLVIGLIVVFWHNVPKKVSEADRVYIKKLVPEIEQNMFNTYDAQIKQIERIQASIMDFTSHDSIIVGINYSESREPKDLFEEKHGLCYDRARSLEKILLSLGYKTRHVSLYDKEEGRSLLKTIMTPQVPSHAILEVKTEKGWMIVDTNNPWLGINKKGNPISLSDLPLEIENWREPVLKGYEMFYDEPCYYIYGLYSRHGRFYPPFTPVPDYNLRELMHNF